MTNEEVELRYRSEKAAADAELRRVLVARAAGTLTLDDRAKGTSYVDLLALREAFILVAAGLQLGEGGDLSAKMTGSMLSDIAFIIDGAVGSKGDFSFLHAFPEEIAAKKLALLDEALAGPIK